MRSLLETRWKVEPDPEMDNSYLLLDEGYFCAMLSPLQVFLWAWGMPSGRAVDSHNSE